MQDIYTVHPASPPGTHVLAMLKGTITLNGNPVDVKISSYKDDAIESNSEHHSNASTGHYLINLQSGSTYRIVYELEGYEPQVTTVDVQGITIYTEVIKDIVFTTPITDTIAPPADSMAYSEIVATYGDVKVDSLFYRVQVGAYHFSENFSLKHLDGLGQLKIELLPDDVTRFSLGDVETLGEAEELKAKVIAAGNKEYPFIIIYYNSERMNLRNMILAPKGLLYRNKFHGG